MRKLVWAALGVIILVAVYFIYDHFSDDGQTVKPKPGEVKTEMVPPPGMQWLPAGELTVQTSAGTGRLRLFVDSFWMAAQPVTVANFEKFVTATGHRTDAEKSRSVALLRRYFSGISGLPATDSVEAGSVMLLNSQPTWVAGANWRYPAGPQQPAARPSDVALHLSWNDAVAYCAWAGFRLPTEAEWEYAVAAGLMKPAEQEWCGDWFAAGYWAGLDSTIQHRNPPGPALWNEPDQQVLPRLLKRATPPPAAGVLHTRLGLAPTLSSSATCCRPVVTQPMWEAQQQLQ